MTQHEKILVIMLRKGLPWYHAEDLMQHGDVFVGYKAQARISEIAIAYPLLIERKPSLKGNRQHMYRIRTENFEEVAKRLPVEWVGIIHDEMEKAKVGMDRLL